MTVTFSERFPVGFKSLRDYKPLGTVETFDLFSKSFKNFRSGMPLFTGSLLVVFEPLVDDRLEGINLYFAINSLWLSEMRLRFFN